MAHSCDESASTSYSIQLPDMRHPSLSSVATDIVDESMEVDTPTQHSVRYLYMYSCQEHGVQPNPEVVKQLPSIIGSDWSRKVTVLDFSMTYLGEDGCLPLACVLSLCPSVTHLLMRSTGLTSGSAKSLIDTLHVHNCITWVDFSKNRLDDDAGRWILTMLLDNCNIRFMELEDSGISPPLLKKIYKIIENRTVGYSNIFQLLNTGRFSSSLAQSAYTVSGISFSASILRPESATLRRRRIPSFAAAGLAELHQRLVHNHDSLQHVYECFILPNSYRNNSLDAEEALVDVMRMNGQWDTISVVAAHSGQCSWKAFFRGLRLLGIPAVSHDLTESITFASVCGICNLETINFGKLLSFLRPHASAVLPNSVQEITSPTSVRSPKKEDTSHAVVSVPRSKSSPIRGLHLREGRREIGGHFARSSPSILTQHESTGKQGRQQGVLLELSITPSSKAVPTNTQRASLDLKVSRDAPGSFEEYNSPNVGKPSVSLASFNELESQGVPPVTNSFQSLEDQLGLRPIFASRRVQHVINRLYDSRNALRESFQPEDNVTDTSTWPLVPFDDILERALSIVGDVHRSTIIAMLEMFSMYVNERVFVNIEEWLTSMYIKNPCSHSGSSLSLGEERRFWRTVEVEALQEAIRRW